MGPMPAWILAHLEREFVSSRRGGGPKCSVTSDSTRIDSELETAGIGRRKKRKSVQEGAGRFLLDFAEADQCFEEISVLANLCRGVGDGNRRGLGIVATGGQGRLARKVGDQDGSIRDSGDYYLAGNRRTVVPLGRVGWVVQAIHEL